MVTSSGRSGRSHDPRSVGQPRQLQNGECTFGESSSWSESWLADRLLMALLIGDGGGGG